MAKYLHDLVATILDNKVIDDGELLRHLRKIPVVLRHFTLKYLQFFVEFSYAFYSVFPIVNLVMLHIL